MRLMLAILIVATRAAGADAPSEAEGVTIGRHYTDEHVHEAGASAGFVIARNFHSMTITPSFGWFIADHVQVSTLVSVTSLKAGAEQSTIVTTTIEPSYHHQLDHRTFVFAGMGFGYSYFHRYDSGLTYTLRAGLQFLIGRTHLFMPSLSYDFRSNKPDMPTLTELAGESALRFNLGYSKLW